MISRSVSASSVSRRAQPARADVFKPQIDGAVDAVGRHDRGRGPESRAAGLKIPKDHTRPAESALAFVVAHGGLAMVAVAE